MRRSQYPARTVPSRAAIWYGMRSPTNGSPDSTTSWNRCQSPDCRHAGNSAAQADADQVVGRASAALDAAAVHEAQLVVDDLAVAVAHRVPDGDVVEHGVERGAEQVLGAPQHVDLGGLGFERLGDVGPGGDEVGGRAAAGVLHQRGEREVDHAAGAVAEVVVARRAERLAGGERLLTPGTQARRQRRVLVPPPALPERLADRLRPDEATPLDRELVGVEQAPGGVEDAGEHERRLVQRLEPA